MIFPWCKLCRDSLRLSRETRPEGEVAMISRLLRCLGAALAPEQPVPALRLAGAAAALHGSALSTLADACGGPASPLPWDARRAWWLQQACQALGQEEREVAWTQGQAMTLEQAISYALEVPVGP